MWGYIYIRIMYIVWFLLDWIYILYLYVYRIKIRRKYLECLLLLLLVFIYTDFVSVLYDVKEDELFFFLRFNYVFGLVGYFFKVEVENV